MSGNVSNDEYVAAQIDSDLFWLESAEWSLRCPQFYADAIDPDVYVSREYAPSNNGSKAYTRLRESYSDGHRSDSENMRTPLPKTFVNIGHTTYGGLVSFYQKRRAGDLRAG